MPLILELSPQLERQLYEAAARSGQSPQAFAAAILADALRGAVGTTAPSALNGSDAPFLSLEDFDAAFDGLAGEHPL